MNAIAFLGLGRMGTLMARRVLAAGHDLTVWNRTAERAGRWSPGARERRRHRPRRRARRRS
jgi:3-hydroxyisobutyrate dehydrogenase-like beta-hydroxyacid dehydrogenase